MAAVVAVVVAVVAVVAAVIRRRPMAARPDRQCRSIQTGSLKAQE